MNEIIPLLQGNFMTKKLPMDLIHKLAGAMINEKYKKSDVIIRYGDEGTHYFILSKGTVSAKVYKPGTDSKAADLEDHIMI